MPIGKEELKRFSEVFLVDAGQYSFLLAFYTSKPKSLLIASNQMHSTLITARAPHKAEWKWKLLKDEEVLEILNKRDFILDRLPKEGIELTQRMIVENESVPVPKTLACMAGNIVEEHEFGESHEIRRGTKHFAPHAKVYCSYAFMGREVQLWKATGKPRKGSRLITVIIDSRLVENLRAEIVYSPSKIDKLLRDGNYFKSKEEAQNYADSVNRWRGKD